MQIVTDQPQAPTAIRTDLGAIFVSLELSRSTWLITSLSPGGGEKMSKHMVRQWRCRWTRLVAGLSAQGQGAGPHGAGRSNHRDLGSGSRRLLDPPLAAGQTGRKPRRSSASIATSRRRRRAKTDKIDGEALVRALLAYKRGEPRCVRHGSSTDPTRGGSPPNLPRAQDADSGAGRARQSDQGAAFRPGHL